MPDEALPPEYEFGKVVGHIVYAVADTAADADNKPQARPATGSVTFTPRETLRVVTTTGYKAIVLSTPFKVLLSATGSLVDAEGNIGIWLVAGDYDVQFALDAPVGGLAPRITSFIIGVSVTHTAADPLDLGEAMP